MQSLFKRSVFQNRIEAASLQRFRNVKTKGWEHFFFSLVTEASHSTSHRLVGKQKYTALRLEPITGVFGILNNRNIGVLDNRLVR